MSLSCFVISKEFQSIYGIVSYVIKLLITSISYIYLSNTLARIQYQKKYLDANSILPWIFFKGLGFQLLENELRFSVDIIKHEYGKTISIPCEIDDEIDSLAYLSKKPRFGSDFEQHYVITVHPRLMFILNSKRLLSFVILHEYAHYVHKDALRKTITSFLLVAVVAAQPLLFLPFFAYSNTANRLCEYAADYFAASYCGKKDSMETLVRIKETSIIDREDISVNLSVSSYPMREKLITILLATHPPIEKRIKFIEGL